MHTLSGSCMNVARPSDPQGSPRAGNRRDFPRVRSECDCMVCRTPHKHPLSGLMCWECWNDGGKDGAFDELLMEREIELAEAEDGE